MPEQICKTEQLDKCPMRVLAIYRHMRISKVIDFVVVGAFCETRVLIPTDKRSKCIRVERHECQQDHLLGSHRIMVAQTLDTLVQLDCTRCIVSGQIFIAILQLHYIHYLCGWHHCSIRPETVGM